MQSLYHTEKDYFAIISRIVKVFRKKEGLSQQELAMHSGVSQSQLSKIERGEHIPSIESLDAIARALNVPTSLITYLALDRGNIQDEFYRKMFETYDMLINFWFYAKNLEEKNAKSPNDPPYKMDSFGSENNDELKDISMELKKLKRQGIKAISGSFIDDYLSSSDN